MNIMASYSLRKCLALSSSQSCIHSPATRMHTWFLTLTKHTHTQTHHTCTTHTCTHTAHTHTHTHTHNTYTTHTQTQRARIHTHTPRLHWKGLIKELLVEVLLGVLNKNDSHSIIIKLRTSRTSHHLKDISDGKVHIMLRLSIKVLCSLDDHEMSWQVHTPGQCTGRNQHL